MKHLITLLFSTLITTVSIAQCEETAGGFGNNTDIPSYNIEGDVVITLNENGESVTLDLGADFMTAAGPDIRAFLVNSGGLTDVQLTNTLIGNLENIQFGLVGDLNGTNQNGAKSFTIDIPADTTLENFDKIFFYCLQFNQFWDLGTFTPFTSENCAILNVENSLVDAFSISPNPTTDSFSINGIGLNDSEIRIFNTLGKQVYQDIFSNTIEIDIHSLTAGLYLVSIINEGGQTTQKLIIE